MAPAVAARSSTSLTPSPASAGNVVPACPSGVAFEREDFLVADFTVDVFLTRRSATVGLERLRDDLGLYLKVLRSAMIELINHDYADFVNLSSNLIGLDSGIQKIRQPLSRFSERAVEVGQSLDSALHTLKSKLAEREALRAKRMALQNLEHVINTLTKIERLLGVAKDSVAEAVPQATLDGVEEEEVLSGDMLERVAADANYLHFCVTKCEAKAFVDEIRPRIELIDRCLQRSLEKQLLMAVALEQRDTVKRCLRIYATLDKIDEAECLVRQRLVAPYLNNVMTEDSLHQDPQGLKGVLQRVLKVIPGHLDLLLQLTQPQAGVLPHFNFLIKSLWLEVVDRFDSNLSAVFSAGNPDKFHTCYSVVIDWLDELERKLGPVEAIEAFRQTPSYVAFIGRWNLTIYFQIRMQQIAVPVELAVGANSLLNSNVDVASPFRTQDGEKMFKLAATDAVLEALRQAWDPSVYVPALTHRFWKLSLQILARFATSLAKVPQKLVDQVHERVANEGKLKPSATSVAMSSMIVQAGPEGHVPKRHNRSASDNGLNTKIAATVADLALSSSAVSEDDLKKGLVYLYLDTTQLIRLMSEEYLLQELVYPVLPAQLCAQATELFSASLREACEQLRGQLPHLSHCLTQLVLGQCLPYLKQVNDIPRLYRRTNRDLPSNCCPYMTSAISPVLAFRSVYSLKCDPETMHTWLRIVFGHMAEQLLSNVTDVLAAVQKMEESLRRLKMVRGVAADDIKGTGPAKALSDDDKIRLQLAQDVDTFVNAMQEVGVATSEIESAQRLQLMVRQATESILLPQPQKPEPTEIGAEE